MLFSLVRFGHVYTDFDGSFAQTSTSAFILDGMPAQPSPLINLTGFHIQTLSLTCKKLVLPGCVPQCSEPASLHPYRKWCAMHTMQLGIYLTVNAEGLLTLAEIKVRSGEAATWGAALKVLFHAFKAWCRANHVQSSQRIWNVRSFHCGENLWSPNDYPWINCKAFNSRVVLGWLADSSLQ